MISFFTLFKIIIQHLILYILKRWLAVIYCIFFDNISVTIFLCYSARSMKNCRRLCLIYKFAIIIAEFDVFVIFDFYPEPIFDSILNFQLSKQPFSFFQLFCFTGINQPDGFFRIQAYRVKGANGQIKVDDRELAGPFFHQTKYFR